MPLYYFQLRDGVDHLLDPEGSLMADVGAAQASALTAARSLMSADVLEGRLRLDMRIDVEDEHGTIVHRLAFQDAIAIIPPEA